MSGRTGELVARTIAELMLYTELHPCAHCDTTESSPLELEPSSPDTRVYVGVCGNCGRSRRYEFRTSPDWDTTSTALGTATPSTIIGPGEFMALADEAEATVAGAPEALDVTAYFDSYGKLWRARRYLQEVEKFIPAGEQTVPFAAFMTDAGRRLQSVDPERFTRAAMRARVGKLDALEKKYLPLKAAMTEQRRQSSPAPPQPFSKARYQAHQSWLQAGRRGEGRLVMQGNRITERLDAIVLDGARFVDCELVKTRFGSTQLNGAELVRVRGTASFISAQLVGARFEACELRGSEMGRARLDQVTIEGGDWSVVGLERAELRNATVRGVSFRGTHFYDCVLDGTTFVDCDFSKAFLNVRDTSYTKMGSTTGTRFVNCDLREVKIGDRRLDGTVFDGCRFHDMIGKPRIEGNYTVINPDFSAGGDGSDIRGPEAVYALWGRPK